MTVTVLSGPERRRRWTTAEKLRIVQESRAHEAVVSEIARRHDVHPNQLHSWRRQARTGVLAGADAGHGARGGRFTAGGQHPERHLASYAGLMQADAYAGFNRLYQATRKPGRIVEAACWAHARRKFFELARLRKAPIAIEAVQRIDALFAIEREINGQPPWERRRVRHEHSRPLIIELETWLREQRRKLSSKSDSRQGDRLQPQALGGAHSLPR